jgi:hypothetical protein
MSKVEKGLEQVQTELRQQKSHVEAVVHQVEKIAANTADRMQKFEDDMKAKSEDIDARLAKLAATTASLPTYAAAAAASVSPSSAALAAPTVQAGSTPPGVAHRPTRIWIKGFKETLTTKYLVNFGNDVSKKLPASLRADACAGAPGFGAVLHLTFPAGTNMADVKKAIGDLKLVHEDEAKQKHPLRTAPDVLSDRHRGRVLGEL